MTDAEIKELLTGIWPRSSVYMYCLGTTGTRLVFVFDDQTLHRVFVDEHNRMYRIPLTVPSPKMFADNFPPNNREQFRIWTPPTIGELTVRP